MLTTDKIIVKCTTFKCIKWSKNVTCKTTFSKSQEKGIVRTNESITIWRKLNMMETKTNQLTSKMAMRDIICNYRRI